MYYNSPTVVVVRCRVRTPELQPPPFRNLREIIAGQLRQAILDGSLRQGQKLLDLEIATRMGVSRTPVRDALRQLERDGLVVSTPNKGASVVELSDREIGQLCEIRAVLEGLAAKWACQNMAAPELARLRAISQEMVALLPFGSDEDRRQFLHKDVEFHERLVAASQSPLLADMLSSIRMRIRLVMAAASLTGMGSAQAAGEHEELVEAIGRKDVEAAQACLLYT